MRNKRNIGKKTTEVSGLPLKQPYIPIQVLVLLIVCVSIELVFILADFSLISPTRLRITAYENGGFWPGLLRDWQPNYTSQPYLMFFTYGFLHNGPAHLLVNMITLFSLSAPILKRVGGIGFTLLYTSSLLGGAVGYALLSSGPQPMVGASGALFGLAGGLLSWMYIDRFTFRQGLLPVVQSVALLVLLNLVMWWAMSGLLAWQTHLGGFLAGWVTAFMIDPRPKEEIFYQE